MPLSEPAKVQSGTWHYFAMRTNRRGKSRLSIEYLNGYNNNTVSQTQTVPVPCTNIDVLPQVGTFELDSDILFGSLVHKLTLGRGASATNDTNSGHVFMSCLQLYNVSLPFYKVISEEVRMKCHGVLTPTDETAMRCPAGFIYYSNMCYKVSSSEKSFLEILLLPMLNY